MAFHQQVRHGWYIIAAGFILAAILFVKPEIKSVQAAGVVVQGTVSTISGTPVVGIQVELHPPDGTSWLTAVTDSTGTYSISDVANPLIPGTIYAVEVSDTPGYNRLIPQVQTFTYLTGDPTRTYNFIVAPTTKTIAGTVTDTTGKLITDARIDITPYNVAGATTSTGRTDTNGQYTAKVIGGSWFAQAIVDLSEYTQRWIGEQPPVRIDFANDTTVESATANFMVTPATGQVTVQLLNSDGSKLTTSNFVADVDFRRADGVGTKRKVRSTDSVVSVYLTPGIYTISAYHNDLAGKSFDPAKTTFVMSENGNVDLGTIYAEVNSAHLKGKITDTSGRAKGNIWLQAIREGGSERPSTNSNSDGTFDLTVGAGTWTIGLNSNDLAHTQINPIIVTVVNGQTLGSLNIQVKDLDRTISGKVVNSNGAVITDYVGSAYVRTIEKKSRVSAPVINGTFSINYSSADITGSSVIVGVEASDNSDYSGGREAKVTYIGRSATKNILVRPYNSSISGRLLIEGTGTLAANVGSEITVEAVNENGDFNSISANSDGTYSLPLAAGTWYYDYSLADPDQTDGLLNTPAGQNVVTIAAGQHLTKTITVRRGRNVITGVVTNASGEVVKSVTVNIDNRPTLENTASSTGQQVVSESVMTDANGVYSIKVPDGTYMITVGDTPAVASNQLMPDAKSVTVKSGQTTTKNLVFETSNATLRGTITYNGHADGLGQITAFTDNGKQATTNVRSNGTYTLSVSSGDTWHLAVTDLRGKKLMMSDMKDIRPAKGINKVNLALKDSGISVPGPVTKTFAADQGGTVSLSNGTSVTLPPFAVDVTGNVTVTVTPTVDLDRTTLDAPATLAYEVKAINSSGLEVKKLNKPVEITVPYDQSTAEKNGLAEKRLEPTYFDQQTQTWESSGTTGLIDTKNNLATIWTDHLSKFSITGTYKPVPKITAIAVKSSNATTTVFTVTGKNFKGKMAAKFGSLSVKTVSLKNGVATITVSTKKLVAGVQTITIINGSGRQAGVSKTIVKHYSSITLK